MQLISQSIVKANENAHEELSRSARYDGNAELCVAVEST